MLKLNVEKALESKAWPYIEAARILEKIGNKAPKKGYVLFETGYGPSGLPHIGTFAEVLRTTMVRKAFEDISDIPTRLICFSDDMDGLRKVPTNIPNQDLIAKNIGMPLTKVPDPFEQEESYGHYMNKKLRSFLDTFGFEYEFCSSTEYYASGQFDHMLLKVIDVYEKIMAIMLPTFGEERKATYSPFMPICKKTGKVLQVPILDVKKDTKTIVFKDEDGDIQETEVTGGKCKLQWKPDFGMRWAALEVDYEMYGKDHMPNAQIYSDICTALGGTPPTQFFYEMFLNEAGEKISKSKGNSLTIDDWLKYAPIESLSLYIYQSPSKAKRLYFDVIPKAVDEYITFNSKYNIEIDEVKKLANPARHIHGNTVPPINMHGLTFGLLLNLASACNPENDTIMWGFINKYASNANKNNEPYLAQLVQKSCLYYNDFIKPNKQYLTPNDSQKALLREIKSMLANLSQSNTPEEIQNHIYAIGTKYYNTELRAYFSELYQILLGQKEGPRLGSFIKLFGIDETIKLIDQHF